MAAVNNLLDPLPPRQTEEIFEELLQRRGVRVERIISWGQASPEGFWYDQPQAEWVLLLAGCARLRFEDQPTPLELRRGSCVLIEAHRKHRVDWTDPSEPTVWLAIHIDEPAE